MAEHHWFPGEVIKILKDSLEQQREQTRLLNRIAEALRGAELPSPTASSLVLTLGKPEPQ